MMPVSSKVVSVRAAVPPQRLVSGVGHQDDFEMRPARAFAPASAARAPGSPAIGRARSIARHDRSPTGSRARMSWCRGDSYRKSTSASDSRMICETTCVPVGSGFAEFQKTSDSQASSSVRNMILAPRSIAKPAARMGRPSWCRRGSICASAASMAVPNFHPTRLHRSCIAGQIGVLSLQSAMHGILAKFGFDPATAARQLQ